MTWKGGRVVSATFHPVANGSLTVVCNGKENTYHVKKGHALTIHP